MSFLAVLNAHSQQSEIESNSSSSSPTLLLVETESNDFARLWFQTNTTDKWGLNAKPTVGQFDNDNTLKSPIIFAYQGIQKLGISSDGKVRINKAYLLPNVDGLSGQVLSTNGSGVLNWSSSNGSKIEDVDGNTYVEARTQDDIVFEIGGDTFLTLKDNAHGFPIFDLESKRDSYFIGKNSGINNGLNAPSSIDASSNIGIGTGSLRLNRSGHSNLGVGTDALGDNTDGDRNVAIGWRALRLTNGSSNTTVGTASLYNLVSGSSNVAVGDGAATFVENGSFSVYIGVRAGFGVGGVHDKNNNTIIGYESGRESTGDGNVFLGYQSGYFENGNNKLYIENSDSSVPLIFGDFSSNEVIINGSLELTGNLIPEAHKSDHLGQDGLAWDNVYADDYVNQGAASFNDRLIVEEIILYKPASKTKGMFDFKTEKGLEELDPASLPTALTEGNGILIDEMSSYNYKANYEQQLIINQQIEEIRSLKSVIDDLIIRVKIIEAK